MLDIPGEIAAFVKHLSPNLIELENEAQLQHELGYFLRQRVQGLKYGLEYNVRRFGLLSAAFVKREIDLCLFSYEPKSLAAVLKLKFPRNGQYPEQMYAFVKDLVFLEQLKGTGFKQAALVIFADERPFYEETDQGIYGFFRARPGTTFAAKTLQGTISKPTGNTSSSLTLRGSYNVNWNVVDKNLRYSVVEV